MVEGVLHPSSVAASVDIWTPEKRSEVMSRIRGRDTKPELIVRSILHGMGYRFTVNAPNNRKLPGRPDIVLPKLKTVVFVHGCYWHRHPGCKLAYTPKTRVEWWQAKFDENVERDQRQQAELTELGWKFFIVWECQTRKADALEALPEQLQRDLPTS